MCVKISSRTVRPIHTLSAASLQETSCGCFSINLKHLVGWSGEQNLHKCQETFTCKSPGQKQCWLFFMMTGLWSTKNLYLKENPWKHRCWKGYWSKVENRSTVVGRKTVGSFFRASGLLILLWFTVTLLVLSGEPWHAKDSHPPYSADFLVFPE